MKHLKTMVAGIGAVTLSLASYGAFALTQEHKTEMPEIDALTYASIPMQKSIQQPIDDTLDNIVIANYHPVQENPEPEPPKSFLASLPIRNNQNGLVKHLVGYGDMLSHIVRDYAPAQATHSERYQLLKDIEVINAIPNIHALQPYSLLSLPIESENPLDHKPYEEMNHDERIAFYTQRTPEQANQYIEDFVEISESVGIDPRLALALSWKESEFNRNAQAVRNGRVTGQGIMQLNPQVHPVSDDYRENIDYALDFLKTMYGQRLRETGNEQIALIRTLASYNAGPGQVNNLIRDGHWDGETIDSMPIDETRIFLTRINDYLGYMDSYLVHD